ncbi:MAG: penicillin-binding protein 1A [Alphaproteobacteria bacterium]|nr:penicillin-binding protein 1A [Alphaproteobacteria bacterium]
MVIRIIGFLTGLGLTLTAVGGFVLGIYLWRLNKELPDYDHLADYAPPVMTRVHAGDGDLLAEFAQEHRLFVPIGAIPKQLIQAFLSAEDKNFYDHNGIDMSGIARAAVKNIFNLLENRRLEGASTITQQVAKNFLLSGDVTIERKLKEAVLAFRLERTFSKDELLELYLNEIYLGMGTYGVAAAALHYFDKPLSQLTLAQMAYLAALPKAPNNYHPFRRPARALARRNWVLARMQDNGFISADEAAQTKAQALQIVPRRSNLSGVDASYFVEEVRRDIQIRYGENRLYGGGLSVRSTLNAHYQKIAVRVLREGLVAYDRRQGWRGAVQNIVDIDEDWASHLRAIPIPTDLAPWRLALVRAIEGEHAIIGLRPRRKISGEFETMREEGRIPLAELKWARAKRKKGRGPRIKSVSDVLAVGDIIWVEALNAPNPQNASQQKASQDKTGQKDIGQQEANQKKIGQQEASQQDTQNELPQQDYMGDYMLRQVPEVNGGLVALDPHTGRVLAMVGGFSFRDSEFNRVTQASRQPGSAFKPFVYAAALDAGYTPASLVLDAPFVMEQGRDMGLWKPENYSREFYGLSTLRLGIEKSRNLMTVRLAQQIGMRPVVEYARRFGIVDYMPPVLSMALGAGETSLMRLTAAYAMLVNGGKYIEPILIDRIQDRYGKTIYRHDVRACDDCNGLWTGQEAPALPDNREQILNPQTAYQIVSMLEGVVMRGTGRSIRAVGKPLAGKTGTTNENRDAWFVGFSPDLAVGIYIGFDNPHTLGETGGQVAAPVFREFMLAALRQAAATPFRIPPSVNLVRINAQTGELAQAGDRPVILEAFKLGTEPAPGRKQRIIGRNEAAPKSETTKAPIIGSGTGGLY